MTVTRLALAVGCILHGCGSNTGAGRDTEPAAPKRALDVQGHRGARGLEPENTLPAFERALNIGVTTLEMDIGLTADGVVVVAHDPALGPDTTRLAGEWIGEPVVIHELPHSVIAGFDVGGIRPGSVYAARFPVQKERPGTHVPTLSQVIELAEGKKKGVIRYNIETKIDPTQPELTASPQEMMAALRKVIDAAGIADRVTVQSFDWRTFRHTGTLKTACLTSEKDHLERGKPGASPWLGGLDVDDFASTPELVKRAGCSIWSPSYKDLDTGDVERAHTLGLTVIPWTVNESVDIRTMIAIGVDGLISDYPDRVRRELAQ